MAFEPEFLPDEKLEHDIFFLISNKPQVRLVLSSHAAYWPVKKTIAMSDPIRTAKAAKESITEVYIGRKSAFGSIAAGIGMAIGGLVWTFVNYPESIWIGYPQALILGGILTAIFGGRRFVLRLQAGKEKLQWVAPIAFGAKVKKDTTTFFATVGEWCKKHGVPVVMGSK